MYYFDTRVRYSELGADDKVTLPAVINYFQDCSTFHSEAAGLGFNKIYEMNRLWVLNAWQIEILRYPRFGEYIRIGTAPYDFKGFYGYRNFLIEDAKENQIARANSIWVYMDTKTGRPVRVTEPDISGYQLEPKLEMEYRDRKVKMPDGWEAGPSFAVAKSQLDTNNHVNNGQYIQMAMDAAGTGSCQRLRAEYKKSALLGDVICPRVHREEGSCTVALCDQSGTPYAVMEFTGSNQRTQENE